MSNKRKTKTIIYRLPMPYGLNIKLKSVDDEVGIVCFKHDWDDKKTEIHEEFYLDDLTEFMPQRLSPPNQNPVKVPQETI